MIFSSTGYVYAVEAGLLEFFLKKLAALAAILAIVVMGCQFILNIKSGFMLVGGVLDNAISAIKYRQLPNELKIGGAWTLLLPLILAPLFSCRSGVTSERLYTDDIVTTAMPIAFSGAGMLIFIFACCFNGSFVAQSIDGLKKDCMKHFGNSESTQKDRAFLEITGSLEQLMLELKAIPANQLPGTLANLGSECEKLLDPDLVLNQTIQYVEESAPNVRTRLLTA